MHKYLALKWSIVGFIGPGNVLCDVYYEREITPNWSLNDILFEYRNHIETFALS
jgi:hypothetical protein